MAAETKIRINGIPPYDGEYELDFDDAFSAREWRWIKKMSEGDLRPGSLTVDDLADPDFAVALVVIAMRRAGKISAEQVLAVGEELSDAPFDDAHIELVLPEVEEEPVPPVLTSEPAEASGSDSLENEQTKNELTESNGSGSRTGSEPSAESPAPTGPMRLGTSLDSARTMSTT